MGGSIDLLIEVFPVVMEQIKSGMIKGLAVSSPYRLPSVPDCQPSSRPAFPASSSPAGSASTGRRACRRRRVRP
jgi:hypothetical protein